MLLKAAKGAAKGLKKELDKSTVTKVFEDAGREFARAATNVVEQVSAEISGNKKKHESTAPPPHDEQREHAAPKDHDEADEFDGVKPTPKAAAPEDPGVRIAIDETTRRSRAERGRSRAPRPHHRAGSAQ